MSVAEEPLVSYGELKHPGAPDQCLRDNILHVWWPAHRYLTFI